MKLATIKKAVKRVFARKPAYSYSITIKVKKEVDGSWTTSYAMSPGMPVNYAMQAIDRVKYKISKSLSDKVYKAGLTQRNAKTRAFVGKQTLGDIL